jgi:hypothetical protein
VSREDRRKLFDVSREDWRKLLPYSPVAAVVVIILVALVMDLTLGGPSNPKLDNSAPPPEVLRATVEAEPVSPTPFVPPATETPTPGPTAVPEVVAQMRDQTRISDLYSMATALEQYRQDNGEYPSTGGNIQSACNYVDIDALCKLKDYIDPIPSDPAGPSVLNGYWYTSDGKSFTLVAGVDSPTDATPAKCEERFTAHTKKDYLFCLTSEPTP